MKLSVAQWEQVQRMLPFDRDKPGNGVPYTPEEAVPIALWNKIEARTIGKYRYQFAAIALTKGEKVYVDRAIFISREEGRWPKDPVRS